MSSMNGSTSASTCDLRHRRRAPPRCRARRPGAGLRARARDRRRDSACGTVAFKRCAPWLPPNTSSRARPVRRGEALRGPATRGDVGAHRIADGARLHAGAEAAGKGLEHLGREARQPAVGQAGDGVLLVDQQRNAQQPRRDARRGRSRSRPRRARRAARIAPQNRARACEHGRGDAERRRQPRRQRPCRECPRTRTHSMGKPFAGTSRDSMLSGTPSHTTGTPRSRSTFATASAGNTWPPGAARHDEDGSCRPPIRRTHCACLPGMRITAERERAFDLVVDAQQHAEPAPGSPAGCCAHSSAAAGSGPWSASTPMFTPMFTMRLHAEPHAEGERHIGLESACRPARPCAKSERRATPARRTSASTPITPTRPSSSASTANTKSVCASGR